MKPIIGILPVVDENMLSSVRAEYARALEGAGGCAVMLPYTKEIDVIDRFVSLCDGFVFAGGKDVDPARYGEEKREVCGSTAQYRDEVEFLAFDRIFASGKPIIGICRGCQLINVALGGTLYQDLPSEHGSDVVHRITDGTAYHEARTLAGAELMGIVGGDVITINSIHHQAIKRLGDGLVPTSHAPDGIIESARHLTHPYLAIYQWHPECMCDREVGRAIFNAFISEVSKERDA